MCTSGKICSQPPGILHSRPLSLQMPKASSNTHIRRQLDQEPVAGADGPVRRGLVARARGSRGIERRHPDAGTLCRRPLADDRKPVIFRRPVARNPVIFRPPVIPHGLPARECVRWKRMAWMQAVVQARHRK